MVCASIIKSELKQINHYTPVHQKNYDNILLIDDEKSIIEGAKKLGMTTVHAMFDSDNLSQSYYAKALDILHNPEPTCDCSPS